MSGSRDISQLHLIRQYVAYLKKYDANNTDLIKKLSKISDLTQGGLCGGFTPVVLYGVWLDTHTAEASSEVKTHNKVSAASNTASTETAVASTAMTQTASTSMVDHKSTPNEKMLDPRISVFEGDWKWTTVKKIFENLADWDGQKDLSGGERADISRVFKQILYFHYIEFIAQGNLSESFADQQGNKMHQNYAYGGLIKAREFGNNKVQRIIQEKTETSSLLSFTFRENSTVLASSHNHLVGGVTTNKSIFFYDPNNKSGVKEISRGSNTDKELVIAMYTANNFSPVAPAPFGFRVFSFNHPEDYPAHADVLKGLTLRPDDKSKDKFTALHIAAKIGSLESINFYLSQIQSLSKEEQTVVIDAQDKDGMTALYWAAQFGFTPVVEALIAKGADFNKGDNGITPPLFVACQANHVATVKTLLESGANASAQDLYMTTSLHIAALKGHTQIAALLLDHRADPFLTSKNDKTPVEFAAEKANTEMVTLILTSMLQKNAAKLEAMLTDKKLPFYIKDDGRREFITAIYKKLLLASSDKKNDSHESSAIIQMTLSTHIKPAHTVHTASVSDDMHAPLVVKDKVAKMPVSAAAAAPKQQRPRAASLSSEHLPVNVNINPRREVVDQKHDQHEVPVIKTDSTHQRRNSY
jgi:ankyrin repeat protein